MKDLFPLLKRFITEAIATSALDVKPGMKLRYTGDNMELPAMSKVVGVKGDQITLGDFRGNVHNISTNDLHSGGFQIVEASASPKKKACGNWLGTTACNKPKGHEGSCGRKPIKETEIGVVTRNQSPTRKTSFDTVSNELPLGSQNGQENDELCPECGETSDEHDSTCPFVNPCPYDRHS